MIPNVKSWVLFVYCITFFSYIANQLKDKNVRKLLKKIRKCFTSLKKKKELISLIWKFNKIELKNWQNF